MKLSPKFTGWMLFFFTLTARADIQVTDGWVRLVPPVSGVTAAYMVLHNNGAQDDALLRVETDVAERVMLHDSTMQNGMMKMAHQEKIDLPAGGATVLSPGGLHVMLMGLRHPLTAGEPVTLRLVFRHQTPVSVVLPVKSEPEKQGSAMTQGMHHHMPQGTSE